MAKLLRDWGTLTILPRETGADFIDKLKKIINSIRLIDPVQVPTDQAIGSKIISSIMNAFPYVYHSLKVSGKVLKLKDLMELITSNESPNMLKESRDTPGPKDPAISVGTIAAYIQAKHNSNHKGQNSRNKSAK